MASNPSMAALSTAICKGVVEGNAPLVQAIVTNSTNNHNLRNVVQTNSDKVWSLDSEVKLLKGFLVTLMGTGDGSSGSVPGLQRDVRNLSDNMSSLKSDVSDLKNDVRGFGDDLRAIREAQTKQDAQTNRMVGGASAAKWLIGMAITVIGGVVGGAVWLITHGTWR